MAGKHHRPRREQRSRPTSGSSKESNKGPICQYCGKRSYGSRKLAREAARIQYPKEKLSAYRCLEAPEFVDAQTLWHLGHLSQKVLNGKVEKQRVHGGDRLQLARPVRNGPVPPELRATIETKLAITKEAEASRTETDNDNEGGQMPTIGETAQLSLTGFDRHKGLYKAVSATSPLKDRVALVHGALRAYALTHSFDDYTLDGKVGFTGRVSLSALVRELFAGEFDNVENQDGFTQSLVQGGNKAGLIKCIDAASGHRDLMPIWWVASSYAKIIGHPPLQDSEARKPAPPQKKARPPAPSRSPEAEAPADGLTPSQKGALTKKRKGKSPGRTPGSRNRSRLEVMSLAERTLKNLGRAVLAEEVYQAADFPVQLGAVRDSLNELAQERRVYKRPISDEDRAAIREQGGPSRIGSGLTQVWAHSSIVDTVNGEKVVPVATWGPAPVLRNEQPAAIVQPVVTDKDNDDDDLDDVIASLEKEAAAPRQSGELDELREEVAALKARLAKVTKQRDRLLAVVETMKDE